MSAFSRDLLGEVMTEYEAADLDRDDLVHWLAYLRDLKAELATFFGIVERDLMAQAGERRWVTPGIGEVTVRKATKRTEWDSEALTRVIVARALDERVLDESTGEFEASHDAVARVLSECARPSWRLTPLRARGIDPSEFCSERDGGYSVELPPR